MTRKFGLYLCLLCVAMLCYAHFFLQNYLMMKPCEQCVYVRFAVCIIAFGAFIAFAFPQKLAKALSYALCFWGVYLGFKHSFLLNQIHQAFKEGNAFGIRGCSHTPNFPFKLPFDEFFPSLFKPNGICGLDTPLIAMEDSISTLQSFFVGSVENNFTDGFYSKGWFVLPQFEFISMAQACLLVFSVFAVGLGVSFLLWGQKNLNYALSAVVFTSALIYLH